MGAGLGSRWNNYLGVSKQMVRINDEPILYRTIRLLKDNGIKDIFVSVPSVGYYGDLGVKETVGRSKYEMDRFLNLPNCSTFLYGDVFYTEQTIKSVIETTRRPLFWGRTDRGQGIGTGVCEVFAVRFNRELWRIAKRLRKKEIKGGSGWNVYFEFMTGGVPQTASERHRTILETTKDNPFYIPITDETEDFDKPKDYEIFVENYRKL